VADLITRSRAQQDINQASFTSAENTLTDTLVTAVSKAVVKYCRREFTSTTYDELYSGSGTDKLLLKEYPIVSVARVASNPTPVLTITNTSNSNQRATVSVSSTGLTLVRVASGVTTTDSSVTFAGNVTINAVAAAVNALGNGWSATVPDSTYGLWASADLRAVQGALNCRQGSSADLLLFTSEETSYRVDTDRGWLVWGTGQQWGWTEDSQGWAFAGGWFPGVDNYRVIYTAGYSTIPEDLQEAVAQWVAALFWQTKDNPATYPDTPPAQVLFILDQYRRHPVGVS
jgi:hypothetical protein